MIHDEFKRLFDELEEHHILLRERLNRLPQDETLLKTLSQELVSFEPWRFQAMDRLGEIAFEEVPQLRESHQQYIRNSHYHRIVQEAPFYRQIMNKPEGYAGDAEMMSIIYRNAFEGDTPFGMLLHKNAVSLASCKAARNRRAFLYEQIKEVMKHEGVILSLAAGPAMEMHDALKNHRDNGITCHALDHDIKTLRHYSNNDRRLTYAIANAFAIIKGNYRIALPRKGIKDYCDPGRDFKGLWRYLSPLLYGFAELKKEAYDLVYTAGLYDYIKTFDDPNKGTVALTNNLFKLVKPGGFLVLGNFSPNNPRDLRFGMEYIYDWQLIYRTEQEVFDFARSIPPAQINHMEVVQEPLGINYFLRIEKR